MLLSQIREGETVRVKQILCARNTRHKMEYLGLVEGVKITVERFAPFNNPIEIILRGFHLAIRKEDANKIVVEKC